MNHMGFRYWRWLGSALGLTIGGRLVFTVVTVFGLAGVLLDPLTNGAQGSNDGGVLLVFLVFALLGIVAADAAFRRARLIVAHVVGRRTV